MLNTKPSFQGNKPLIDLNVSIKLTKEKNGNLPNGAQGVYF